MALRPLAAAPLLALLVSSAQEPVPPAIRYEQHVFAGGNPPPAGTLQNPFTGDMKSVADGEKLFAVFNCDGCHGGGAVGFVGPSLADGHWRYGAAVRVAVHSASFAPPARVPSVT